MELGLPDLGGLSILETRELYSCFVGMDWAWFHLLQGWMISSCPKYYKAVQVTHLFTKAMKEHHVKCLQKEENKRANTRANIYMQLSFNCGILDIFYDLKEVIEKENGHRFFSVLLVWFCKICVYLYILLHT